MHDLDLDMASLAIPVRVTTRPRPQPQRGAFLRGPISFAWLCAAAQAPGRALHVAIAIQFLAGIARGTTVELRPSTLRLLGVDRFAAYRGLAALERAQLVTVRRHRGRSPSVTIVGEGPRG